MHLGVFPRRPRVMWAKCLNCPSTFCILKGNTAESCIALLRTLPGNQMWGIQLSADAYGALFFINTIFMYTFRTKLRWFIWRSCFAHSVRTLERIANTGYPAEVDWDCSTTPAPALLGQNINQNINKISLYFGSGWVDLQSWNSWVQRFCGNSVMCALLRVF